MARKYDYLYVLQGNYGQGFEDLCAEDKAALGARKRIRVSMREYEANDGGRYRIIERRELRAKET